MSSRKLVLGLGALLSVAVVVALFVLLRGDPHPIDARPALPNDVIATEVVRELPATSEVSERAEVLAKTDTRAADVRRAARAELRDAITPPDSFIAGDVVDDSGRALARVTVSAIRYWRDEQMWRDGVASIPAASLRPTTCLTDSDGHFRIALQGGTRVCLFAEREGLEDFQDSQKGDGRAAGTSDVHIVMRALPIARFRVVDARTQQPIESFGMRLSGLSETKGRAMLGYFRERNSPLKIEPHPGGVCELFERAEKSEAVILSHGIVNIEDLDPSEREAMATLAMSGYQIEAPGFAPQCERITPAAHAPEGQTIRLERGGSISARALLDGKPASSVSASAQFVQLGDAAANFAVTDTTSFLGRSRRIESTGAGELRFVDLAAGTYELELWIHGKAKLVIERVDVVLGTETALGDVRMTSFPRVTCKLLTPGGRIPLLYKVTAECAGEKSVNKVDSSGMFSVIDLAPGHWKFEAPGEPSFFCAGPPLEFDVTADQRELTLDLRARSGGWLTLNVRMNGAPAPGVTLSARAGTLVVADGQHTDQRGRAVLWLAAANPVDVFFTTVKGLPLGRASDTIAVPHDGDVEVNCDLYAGELVLDVASLTDIQSDTPLKLELDCPREPGMNASIQLVHKRLERSSYSSVPKRETPGLVGAGAYRALLVASFRNAVDGSTSSVEYRRDLVIRAGEVNELRFTEEDRLK